MRITAAVLYDVNKPAATTAPPHPRQDMPRICDWVTRGLLDVDGLVTRRYPLAQINRAYEDIETDAVGRGVLVFS